MPSLLPIFLIIFCFSGSNKHTGRTERSHPTKWRPTRTAWGPDHCPPLDPAGPAGGARDPHRPAGPSSRQNRNRTIPNSQGWATGWSTSHRLCCSTTAAATTTCRHTSILRGCEQYCAADRHAVNSCSDDEPSCSSPLLRALGCAHCWSANDHGQGWIRLNWVKGTPLFNTNLNSNSY